MKTICMAGWALTAILATTPARGVTDRTAVVRERVLGFAKANLGRKVGNGECAALAFQALRAAGAKPRAAHGFPTPRDYVWGKLVLLADATPQGLRMTGALNDVRPGDIAQFSNARLGRKHFAHHTAIVADIKATNVGLLEQKVAGRRFVVEGGVPLERLSAGWIRFNRPIPLHS